MPYCPECKAEYREGFSICSDCNVELVDILEEEEIETIHEEFVPLIKAYDSIHADLINQLLAENNIPSSSSSRTHLDVIMGNSTSGREIFVPASFLNDAKKVIEEIESEIIETDQKNKAIEDKNNVRSRTWVILWIFFIPGIIIGAIGALFAIFDLLLD